MSGMKDLNGLDASDKVEFKILNYNLDLPYLLNDFAPDSPLQPQVLSISLENFDLNDPTQGPKLKVSMRVPASKYAYLVANNRELPLTLQGVPSATQPTSTPSREATPPSEPQGVSQAVPDDLDPEKDSGKIDNVNDAPKAQSSKPTESPEPAKTTEPVNESGDASVPNDENSAQQSPLSTDAHGSDKKDEGQSKDLNATNIPAKAAPNSETEQPRTESQPVPQPVQPTSGKESTPTPIPSVPAGRVHRESRRTTAEEQERDRIKSQQIREFNSSRNLKRSRSPEPSPVSAAAGKRERKRKDSTKIPEAEAQAPKGSAAKAKNQAHLSVDGANACFDLLKIQEIKTPKAYSNAAVPSLESFEPARSISWRNLFGENTCAETKPLRPAFSRESSRLLNRSFVTRPIDSLSDKIGHEIDNPLLPKHPKENNKFSPEEITMLYHWIVQGQSLKYILGKFNSTRSDYSISRMLMILRADIRQFKVVRGGSFDVRKLTPSVNPIPADDIAKFNRVLKSLPKK